MIKIISKKRFNAMKEEIVSLQFSNDNLRNEVSVLKQKLKEWSNKYALKISELHEIKNAWDKEKNASKNNSNKIFYTPKTENKPVKQNRPKDNLLRTEQTIPDLKK